MHSARMQEHVARKCGQNQAQEQCWNVFTHTHRDGSGPGVGTDKTDATRASTLEDMLLSLFGTRERTNMANTFGTDILIQAPDPRNAAFFYVQQLGFEITDETPDLISLHGEHINLFIERGPALGPVLEVTVDGVEEAKLRLVKNGCEIIKDEPGFPRCYVKDPFGLIYNLTS